MHLFSTWVYATLVSLTSVCFDKYHGYALVVHFLEIFINCKGFVAYTWPYIVQLYVSFYLSSMVISSHPCSSYLTMNNISNKILKML